MTRTTLVAMTVITLGLASDALAQSVDGTYGASPSSQATVLPMDPLDPVSRAAMLVARSGRPATAPPLTTPSNVVVFFPAPEIPAPASQPQLARIAGERAGAPVRHLSPLNGIGAQASGQALDSLSASRQAR
jgi:hypothetical protein